MCSHILTNKKQVEYNILSRLCTAKVHSNYTYMRTFLRKTVYSDIYIFSNLYSIIIFLILIFYISSCINCIFNIGKRSHSTVITVRRARQGFGTFSLFQLTPESPEELYSKAKFLWGRRYIFVVLPSPRRYSLEVNHKIFQTLFISCNGRT